MNYQSITAYLHDRDATSEALEWAIEAARLWQAHLTVICCGISTAEPGFYYAGAQAVVVQRNVEMAQETADLLAQKVQQRLAREVISWEVETYTLMPSGIEQFFRSYVRFTIFWSCQHLTRAIAASMTESHLKPGFLRLMCRWW